MAGGRIPLINPRLGSNMRSDSQDNDSRRNVIIPVRRFPNLGEDVLPPSGPSFQDILDKLSRQLSVLSSTLVIRRGMGSRRVTVSTTPTKIVYATGTKAFLFLNPASSVQSGVTITQALIGTAAAAVTLSAAGNTQATALGVANYLDCDLHLQISNVVGAPVINFYTQVQNPISSGWADAQLVFASGLVAGEYYADLGMLGVATNFAIRWDYAGGGPGVDTMDVRLGATLKNGLPGTSTGASRTIYLGNAGVSTVSGYPLLEGQTLPAYLEENTELWAVANASVTLNIFELQ